MLVAPVLLVLSSGATVFITTQLGAITKRFDVLGILGLLVFVLLEITTFAIMWVLFTFLYLMPNRHVNRRSGVIAPASSPERCTSSSRWSCVEVPGGRRLLTHLRQLRRPAPLSPRGAAQLAHRAGQRRMPEVTSMPAASVRTRCGTREPFLPAAFGPADRQPRDPQVREGEVPLTAAGVSEPRDPWELTEELLEALAESGVLIEADRQGRDEAAYVPARDTDLLTMKFVMDALDRRGVDRIPVAATEELQRIEQAWAFGEAIH